MTIYHLSLNFHTFLRPYSYWKEARHCCFPKDIGLISLFFSGMGPCCPYFFCKRKLCCAKPLCYFKSTVNSRFKKEPKLQIHLHKAFFSDDRFLDSLQKSFLNQTLLDLRKDKRTFLNLLSNGQRL